MNRYDTSNTSNLRELAVSVERADYRLRAKILGSPHAYRHGDLIVETVTVAPYSANVIARDMGQYDDYLQARRAMLAQRNLNEGSAADLAMRLESCRESAKSYGGNIAYGDFDTRNPLDENGMWKF